MKKLIYAGIILLVSNLVFAVPIEVGSGQNQAGVFMMWSDGYSVEFNVNFEGAATGLGLLEAIDAVLADNFTVTTTDWGWGITVDGIEYIDGLGGIHFNPGYTGGENWWHYWNKDAGQSDWAESWVGCKDRVVNNGDCDGWVYGFNTIPEPATLAIFGLGFILLRRKKVTAEYII